MKELLADNPSVSREISKGQFESAALALNVPLAAVRAVAEVESSKEPFLPSGRPTILYEAHIFHRLTEGRFKKEKDGKGVALSSEKWDKSLYGKGGEHQYERLNAAMKLDPDAALQSCSWGAFQIMGFNYTECGYQSIYEMVQDMVSGADGHLRAFVGYVLGRNLDEYLRRLPDPQAAAQFAEAYNGPGYKQNHYDDKLLKAYDRWSRDGKPPPKDTSPLRLGSRGGAVHTLQVRLGVPADGIYGPETEQAVRTVQRLSGIQEDGLAGKDTHGKLGLPWPPISE